MTSPASSVGSPPKCDSVKEGTRSLPILRCDSGPSGARLAPAGACRHVPSTQQMLDKRPSTQSLPASGLLRLGSDEGVLVLDCGGVRPATATRRSGSDASCSSSTMGELWVRLPEVGGAPSHDEKRDSLSRCKLASAETLTSSESRTPGRSAGGDGSLSAPDEAPHQSGVRRLASRVMSALSTRNPPVGRNQSSLSPCGLMPPTLECAPLHCHHQRCLPADGAPPVPNPYARSSSMDDPKASFHAVVYASEAEGPLLRPDVPPCATWNCGLDDVAPMCSYCSVCRVHQQEDSGTHPRKVSHGRKCAFDVDPHGTSPPCDDSATRARRCGFSSGIGEPSVYHALVVIFLEFFSWGLLTAPMIVVLDETFPDHTFLMNGLIVGIKGILSFLSAPLIGALSDVWGRKFFLFVTVFFTCLPIPFMKIDTWWYFALISMSGVFAVTFSIVFAYVADVTDEAERSNAYGLVSATFAASLVTSPALGAYLGKVHSDDLVVGLATAIAVLDVLFVLVAVPESLPEKLRIPSNWSTHISWEQADPFSALWKVSKDRNILLISVTVFLSYLPEAGQYSCFFVYLRLVMGFNAELVATFIAVIGILSVIAQTVLLGLLMRTLSNKSVIIIGLVFEMMQLAWYGFGSQMWMMWAAGVLAAVSSITYPAISGYLSTHADADKQGVVQGIVTGIRGLCSGLGPVVFGFIFYLFHVDLNESSHGNNELAAQPSNTTNVGSSQFSAMVPGPPFVFGSLLVIMALLVSAFIPDSSGSLQTKGRKQSGASNVDLSYERGHKKTDSLDAASLPLMDETGVL